MVEMPTLSPYGIVVPRYPDASVINNRQFFVGIMWLLVLPKRLEIRTSGEVIKQIEGDRIWIWQFRISIVMSALGIRRIEYLSEGCSLRSATDTASLFNFV